MHGGVFHSRVGSLAKGTSATPGLDCCATAAPGGGGGAGTAFGDEGGVGLAAASTTPFPPFAAALGEAGG
eukprot:11626682-Alexandrium_andersonii.AAC.1